MIKEIKETAYIEITTTRKIRRSTVRAKLTRYENLKNELLKQEMSLRAQMVNVDKKIADLKQVLAIVTDLNKKALGIESN